MESHIYILGSIGQGGVTADYVKSQLDQSKDSKNLIVHIASNGGEVYEGYTIYNLLRNSGKNIEVRIEGFCASIATLIALAATDLPSINPTASFLIHNPFIEVQGDANALRKAAEHLDEIKKTLISVYKDKSGLPEDQLWAMMDKETSFTPQEAETAGFARVSQQSFKAVAYFDLSNFNSKTMAEEGKGLIEDLKKELSGFKNMITKMLKPKNLEVKLQDGSMIYIEAEGDITGAAIYKVDTTGAMLPLDDGSYVLEDGRTVVVKSGLVESVADPVASQANPELDTLKAEVERLTSELQAKNEETLSLKNEVETKDVALADLSAKVETILAKLPAGDTKNHVAKAFKPIEPKAKVAEQQSALSGWAANIIAEKMA